MPQTECVFFADETGAAPGITWLDSLPPKVQDKCIAFVERLSEQGYDLRRPTCDYLRDEAKHMARTKKTTTNAVEILRKRYIQGDVQREKSVTNEHLNAEIARMIYELRKEAALSQADLAELIGTTQSVISRLEDSDYDGHSLSMLDRIATALNRRLTVSMKEMQVREGTVHYAFRRLMQNVRRKSGLTIEKASKKLAIDSAELERLECDRSYQPSARTLGKLSQFYGIEQERLAALAGGLNHASSELKARASKFATQADSIAKLSKEEKKTLDEFMRFLNNV